MATAKRKTTAKVRSRKITQPAKEISKAERVLRPLRGAERVSPADLVDATGCQPHTTRAPLTGRRTKDHSLANGESRPRHYLQHRGMTMAWLEQQLATLATMHSTDLLTEWQRVHRAPAPKLPPDLLRIALAYRLQERAIGGPSRTTVSTLRRFAQLGTGVGRIKAGTRLVRSWNGRTISVLVEEEGFLFEDRSYRSLSAIAREATGSAWSGPRFFGVTGRDSDG